MTTATAKDLDHVLAVVLDRAHARFFEVAKSGTTERVDLRTSAMRGRRFHSDRQGGPGWGEREYHGRIREEEHRHVAGVVEQLRQLDRAQTADGILLAGPGPATAALARALPPALANRVIGVTHLTPRSATAATVARAIDATRAGHRHDEEGTLVRAVEQGLGRGTATNGPRETLRALARGQVRTLIMVAGVSGAGFRCSASGRLALTAADCLGEGDAVSEPDLMGRVREQSRREGATVEVIHDPALATRIDGLAALLRFAS